MKCGGWLLAVETKKKKTAAPKKEDAGLKLDPKTMIGITVLLALVIVAAGIMTQVVPRGEYRLDEAGQIVNGTYAPIDDYKMPIWKIILSPILCFTMSQAATGALIILFIVLIGGSFLLLDKCGAMKYMMAFLANRFREKKYVLLCLVMLFFMALSSVSGVLEESVTLVPIACAISLAMGWDSLVGLCMSLIAVAFGFTAATFNPFNVVTVQKMAGLDVFSGLWYRLIVFAVVYAILAVFTVRYAKKIEKDPRRSTVYESDRLLREKYNMADSAEILANPHIKKGARAFCICLCAILCCTVTDFTLQLFGVETGGAISLAGMALLFTLGGILAGHFAGLTGRQLLRGFGSGVKTVAPALPLIIFVLAVTYVLNEGKILHTILYYIYNAVQGVSPHAAILLTFLLVAVLEFFVGSGTAKAFLIMPILLPLSDLLGLSRQSVVLSFCMGDGFTNLLYPTSGIMIIAIGLIGVSYGKWLRFGGKLLLLEGIAAVALMLIAVSVGYH